MFNVLNYFCTAIPLGDRAGCGKDEEEFGDKCYYFSEKDEKHDKAKDKCRKKHGHGHGKGHGKGNGKGKGKGNGHLVVIDSEEENDFVASRL